MTLVTKFKQVEKEASNRVFRKYIFSRCDNPHMGMGTRLLLR